ncbi:response regulator [Duganella callida]|uniref:Response regulator transcription factor n=1 Tax=Duganella callida TaxID=2561932 RepID=A0A4Y9S9P1_9BURK|nr:response regulator transcription factor [Duganella callida]TFW16800.1 response regulator transcription factor [Duganella callida]
MSSHPAAIRILLADDHAMFRSGIAALLLQQPQMTLVAEAEDGQQAVALYQQHRPDITLMDLQMNGMDGVVTIEAIRAIDPAARIIAVTTYSSEVLVHRAMRAGVSSYLLKSMLIKELITTIDCVHRGQRHLPAEIAQMLSFSLNNEQLTRREIEVLSLAAQGNSNKMIASRLGISEDTVKSYMSTLFGKLGANDRTHAVALALKSGLIAS